jgi:hypothetical protein
MNPFKKLAMMVLGIEVRHLMKYQVGYDVNDKPLFVYSGPEAEVYLKDKLDLWQNSVEVE